MMAVASGSTSTNDGAPIILDFNPEADGDPIHVPLNVNFLDQKSKLSDVECSVAIAAAS